MAEAKLEGHDQMLMDIRSAIVDLEARMDRRFDAVDRRFEAIDRRFEAIDRRFEGVDLRFIGIDQRLENIDTKISKQFVWLVGLQVTSLIAIVGALGGVIAAILSR